MLKKAREGAYLTDYGLEDERILLFGEGGCNGGTLAGGQQCDPLTSATVASCSHMNKEDSGLGSCGGSSSGAAGGGPSHIEDWQSLSVLLPRYAFNLIYF